MKNISPVLGFNTNVRHKGKVFHIQTEDSGVKHPHIITHLFADGGRILKSTKASYAEHLSEPNLTERVRTMMKDQHKAMFMALRDGTYDGLLDEGAAPASRSAIAAPSPPAAEPKPAPGAPEPPSEDAQPALSVRADPAAAKAWSAAVAPTTATATPAEPPPPAPAASSANAPAPTPTRPDPAAGRYVASRPAAIFASARPSEGGNVFGEDMISDKSLDEVILTFLADEVGPGDDKDGGKS